MLGNRLFSNTSVSMEMIEPQVDDKLVNDLELEFTKLINLTDRFSNKLVSGKAYFKHKETLAVIKNIDKIIEKRTGLSITHVNSKTTAYAVIPVSPINENVISLNVKERVDLYKTLLGKNKTQYDPDKKEITENDVKDVNKVRDLEEDTNSVIYHTYNSFMKLEKALNTDNIKIDLKKARIDKLPKDFKIYIIANFYICIRQNKLTARELAAVLLHEVGHAFTHIEYSYRTVMNTSSILDSVRKDLSKGKSVKDSFLLAYRSLEGEKDLKDKNESIVAINLLDKYMSSTMLLHKHDRHSFTDSEQLADQFANRFGLGVELSTALAKFTDGSLVKVSLSENILINVVFSFFSIILLLVSLPFLVSYMITSVIFTILLGGHDSNATVYDDKVRRFLRIKNDMIRVLRTSDLDKSSIKLMINNIEEVEGIIESLDTNKSLLDTIGDNVLPWNRSVSSFTKLEQILEDLSENRLHLSTRKLKNI